MPDTTEWRRLFTEVRKVLLEVWDPIGVRNMPAAQDEYDSYVRVVSNRLLQGVSEGELVEHLYSIESQTIGLAVPDKALLRPVADALKKIRF